MVNYLLTCRCGEGMHVSTGEAGGTTQCPACGTRVGVPSLRNLKTLATVEVVDEEENPQRDYDALRFRWSVRILFLTTVFFWAGDIYAMAVSGERMPLPLRWVLFVIGLGVAGEMFFFLIRLRDVHGNRPI